MPGRISRSQIRSQMRQAQRKAVNEINKEIKKINNTNKRNVDNYNRKVSAHNARVRSNRRRLLAELNRLNSRTTTTRYVTYQTSVQTLQRSFVRIEEASERGTWTSDDDLFEMAEGEAANSIAVLNALLDEPMAGASDDDSRLRDTVITNELSDISTDLDNRWRGALFSLSPMNPDAARQFCTSTREVFVTLLDLKAPDKAVLAANANILLTDKGQVPRREKIRFCLARNGHLDPELVDFVEDDINNVMDLFGTLNPATHGEAGLYDLTQLRVIKTRVEDAIQFLNRIVSF